MSHPLELRKTLSYVLFYFLWVLLFYFYLVRFVWSFVLFYVIRFVCSTIPDSNKIEDWKGAEMG